MEPECRVLGRSDAHLLSSVVPGLFDNAVNERLVDEFLTDPRHHLVVAIDAGRVVGFVSALHYINPDKPAELWINESRLRRNIDAKAWVAACCKGF